MRCYIYIRMCDLRNAHRLAPGAPGDPPSRTPDHRHGTPPGAPPSVFARRGEVPDSRRGTVRMRCGCTAHRRAARASADHRAGAVRIALRHVEWTGRVSGNVALP